MNSSESPINPPETSKPIVKKVSELSPEYQEDRSTEQYVSKEMRDFFGSATLKSVEDIRRHSKSIDEQLSPFPPLLREAIRENIVRRSLSPIEAEAQIKKALRENLADFRKLVTNGKTGTAAEDMLREAVDNSQIREQIKRESEMLGLSTRTRVKYSVPQYRSPIPSERLSAQLLGRAQYGDQDLIYLNALIGGRRISEALWTLILENHRKQFEESITAFRENLGPELSNVFHQRIQKAIEQGELPMEPALLERRLAETTITVRDAIEASFDERSGTYDPDRSLVKIDSNLTKPRNKKKLEETYFHEMFHALSGRTIVGETFTYGEHKYTDFKHQRTGTHFRISETRVNRFKWLNEALTERLALRYTDQGDQREKYSYYEEEQLLELLLKNGKVPLDERVFLEAYFENLDPTMPSDKCLPGWKVLSEKIEAAWGAGFLNRLDEQVKKVSPAGALEWLKKES